MKKLVLFLLILVGAVIAPAQSDYRPNVGDVLKRQYIPKHPKEMAAGCCFFPFIEKEFGGVRYTIAFDHDSRKIVYLSTTDKRFKSRDGFQVGDKIAISLAETLSSGGSLYGPATIDGWYPVVGYMLSIPTDKGIWESLDPFDRTKPTDKLTVEIMSFGKGMWGK